MYPQHVLESNVVQLTKLMLHMLKYTKNVSPFLLLSGNDSKQIPHLLKHANYKTSQSNHAQTLQILLLTLYCSTVRTHSLRVLQSGFYLVSNSDCRSLNFSWILDAVFLGLRWSPSVRSVLHWGKDYLGTQHRVFWTMEACQTEVAASKHLLAAFMFLCCRSERPCFKPQ